MSGTDEGAGPHLGYSAAQVRAAERPLLDAGVPLMARAAAGLAEELRRMLAERPAPWRLLVLAGSGDNGGDALYAAAQVGAEGHTVRIVRTGSRVHEAAAAACEEAGGQLADISQAAVIARDSDLILDGIVGTGSNAGLRGTARQAVQAILPALGAPAHPLVVAVDIPSGIDPDTGETPDGTVLPADTTVTFGGCKAGLLRGRGQELAGNIVLVDIGLGDALSRVTPIVDSRG